MTTNKKKVLRIYDNRAIFENGATGNCIVITPLKEGSAAKDIQVVHRSELDMGGGGPAEVIPLEGIFGIYDLLSGPYAALVVESEPFVSHSTINIRKAKKIITVPMFRNGKLLSEIKQRDEERYLQLLQKAFTDHQFFFSLTNDITLTQQRIAKLAYNHQQQQASSSTASILSANSSSSPSHPHWERADPRFFWNLDVVMDFARHIGSEASEWVIPFMSAYIEYRPDCEVEGQKFTILFISRRSRYRQGCRFTKRGLDENGNAANFVETEQILMYPDGKVTSYVQIRGSMPFQWASPVLMKYDPVVYIGANRAKNVEMAHKHVTDIVMHYSDNNGSGSVVFINLVDNKKDQGRLGTEFKEVVEALHSRVAHPLLFYWFDFHHECKQKGKWQNLSKLVKLVDERFRAQKYFCRHANGAVLSWQSGVIRTNCMDNLDRTNVVQSLFARRSLMMQLGHSQLLESSTYVLNTPWKAFEKIYKTMWANNADAISTLYAGTGALKVDFTKTGKRTLRGMFNDGVNSCMRYYLNNFTDGTKQDAIDLMLGNYRPDPSGASPFVPRPGQETLGSNATKIFVVIIFIFSALLLVMPPSTSPAPLAPPSAALSGVGDGPLTSPQNASTASSSAALLEPSTAAAAAAAAATATGASISSSSPLSSLSFHLTASLLTSGLLLMYVSYTVVKKGSKIGMKVVVHPQLVPEALPNAPA